MTSVTEAPPGRDWITRSYEVRKSVAAYAETRGSGEHSEFLQSRRERCEHRIIWCGLCKWWMRDYSVRVRRKRSSVPPVCRPRRWPVAGRHLTAGSFWEVSVDALMLSACIPTQPVSFSLILSCAQFAGRLLLCVKFNIQPCACFFPPSPLSVKITAIAGDKRATCCDYYSLNISTFQKCLMRPKWWWIVPQVGKCQLQSKPHKLPLLQTEIGTYGQLRYAKKRERTGLCILSCAPVAIYRHSIPSRPHLLDFHSNHRIKCP